MKRLAVVGAMILSSTFGILAVDDAAIRQLVTKHDYPALIEKLVAVRSSDAKAFTRSDYDYLLARTAELEGFIALAIVNYRSVVDRESALKPYALAHLASLMRTNGNLALERIYLRELLLLSEKGEIVSAAKDRLARNAFESANYKESIRIINLIASDGDTTSVENTRNLRAFLGEAYRMSGDVGKAKQIFDDILSKTVNLSQPDDAALTAVKNLDAINGSDPFLGEAEHWRRASIYQFNRYFVNARVHYEAVFAANRAGPNAAEALFQIGRGFAQQENFVEAIAWYERVLEQFSTSPIAKDALLQAAAGYSRVGKPKEAITRYESFIEKYPTDEKLDRAFLNIVDVDRDRGSDSDALKWCARTAETFKGKVPEALAIFAEARIHLAKEDWPGALAALDRLKALADLGGASSPGGATKSEVTFLRGFVLEQQQRYPEAIDAYLTLSDGRAEYYGWRSTERLAKLGENAAAKPSIDNSLREALDGLRSKDAEQKRQGALAVLRLTDDRQTREQALDVLRNLPKYRVPTFSSLESRSQSEAARRLLALGLTDEASPNKTTSDLAEIEGIWKKMPADFPLQLIPPEHLRVLYPAPFADELIEHAATRGVDPRFVLAIQRQESRFAPYARSDAAARGLMQFIHTTADRVSNQLGYAAFDDSELYDASVSIRFGSHYLAELFTMFPDRHEAVAAAYNGGETNVKRWLARVDSSQPERYLPEIVFGQSKDYAARVMANYRMYQYLYDERLALKSSARSE